MASLALPLGPLSARQALVWVRRRRREAAGGALVASAVLGAFALIANPAGSSPRLPSEEERALASAPPQTQAITPFQVRAIEPDKAVALNAAVPLADGPNPAARPFKAAPVKSLTYARSLQCLAQAIYYEAALEPEDGQRAVAQVVLNRTRHPTYPASVCGVVFQGHERDTGCQFSFTCDGSLARAPMRDYWERARRIAHEALQGYVHAPVGNATHYHANYVVPYWASTLNKNAVVGTHIFYRWKGGWGQPAAFAQNYSRKESDPHALKTAALAAEARDRATPDVLTGDEAEVVVEAKRELPPELAKLVEAEIGKKGETRIGVRLPTGIPADAKPGQPVTPNLNWTLTGKTEATEQKPLGRPVATNAPGPKAAPPAPSSGGATP